MPGIASIRLVREVSAALPPADQDLLDDAFALIFTRRLERDWARLIVAGDSPTWEALMVRLDDVVKATDIGGAGAGIVQPGPMPSPEELKAKWTWGTNWHYGPRDLEVASAPYTVTADSNRLEAVIRAEYAWEEGTLLP